MKRKSPLFALVALMMMFASCSKDNKSGNGGNDPDGTGIVQLSIDRSSFGTRAFPGNAADATEVNIYNYAVLVFNSNRLLEHTVYETFAGANGGTAVPGDITIDPFEVTLGLKYFLVLANVPVSSLMQEQDNFSPDQDVLATGIQEYVFELESIDQIMGYLKSGSFVNDNGKNRGFMMTTLTGLVPENINVEKDLGTNTINLKLGRAMAKVSITDNIVAAEQPWGTLENIEYKVGNNPKKMYVVPHFLDLSATLINTPNYADATVKASDYFGPLDDFQKSSKTGQVTYTYCTENANQRPKMGNSTVAIIKGKFVPKNDFIFDADRTTSKTVADLVNGTFYRIKDTATESYVDDYFYAADPTASLLAGEEVVVYNEGICYYTLYLRNPNKTDNDKYSVARNSLYKITISKINGAGEPDEGGLIVDPELPLDATGLIDGTIELAEWDEIEWPGAEL